jgi:hypothetical protein
MYLYVDKTTKFDFKKVDLDSLIQEELHEDTRG